MLSHESGTAATIINRSIGDFRPPRTTGGGVFADGIWHCDCAQRMPAEHFRVKKEGKNQGKWFYCCQHSNRDDKKRKGCGFFLWDNEAKVREEATLLNNSRSEKRATSQLTAELDSPASYGKADQRSPRMASESIFGGGAKVQADGDESDSASSEEAFGSPLKAKSDAIETDRKRKYAATESYGMAESMGQPSMRSSTTLFETPRKAPRINHGYMTPADTVESSKTALLPQTYTPITPIQLSRPTTMVDPMAPIPPPGIIFRNGMPGRNGRPVAPPIEITTPTAQIINDPMEQAAPSVSKRHIDATTNMDSEDSRLVNRVMAELSSISIPPATEQKLRDMLSIHELRAEGVKKGRDATREALAARAKEIADLKANVSRLETELRTTKNALLQHSMQSGSARQATNIGRSLRS